MLVYVHLESTHTIGLYFRLLLSYLLIYLTLKLMSSVQIQSHRKKTSAQQLMRLPILAESKFVLKSVNEQQP